MQSIVNDLRSLTMPLEQYRMKGLKNSGLDVTRNRDLCDTGARHYVGP